MENVTYPLQQNLTAKREFVVCSCIILCWRGAGKGWDFFLYFEVWFRNLAYLQEKKKEEGGQYSLVDHTGKAHYRLFLYANM